MLTIRTLPGADRGASVGGQVALARNLCVVYVTWQTRERDCWTGSLLVGASCNDGGGRDHSMNQPVAART